MASVFDSILGRLRGAVGLPEIQAGYDSGSPAQKANFQASVSGATQPTAPRIVVVGDSRAADWRVNATDTVNVSTISALDKLMCGQWDIVKSYAVGGKRLDQVLSEQLVSVAADLPATKATHVYMDCGHNNFLAGQTLAQVIADFDLVAAEVKRLGLKLICLTSMPGTLLSTYAKRAITEYNDYVMVGNSWRTGYAAFDVVAHQIDPATGVFFAGYTYDGTHTSGRGAMAGALGVYQGIHDFLGLVATSSAFARSSDMMPNPLLVGSVAASGAGVSGVLPTDISAGTFGSFAATYSKEPSGNLDKLVVAIDSSGGSYTNYAILEQKVFMYPWVDGSWGYSTHLIKPTAWNGRIYRVLVEGPVGAEPSTLPKIGDVFVSGGATLLCMAGPAADGKITALADIELSGTTDVSIQQMVLDGAFAYYYTNAPHPPDSHDPASHTLPRKIWIKSQPFSAGVTASQIVIWLKIYGLAGATAKISRFSILAA